MIPKWLWPILATVLLGSVATSAVATFKASEAYTDSQVLQLDSATNKAEHESIKETLKRIDNNVSKLTDALLKKGNK